MTTDDPPLGTGDVGKLLNGIKPYSVRRYLRESQAGGRYAHHPFPEPDGKIGRNFFWNRNRIPEIIAWDQARSMNGR